MPKIQEDLPLVVTHLQEKTEEYKLHLSHFMHLVSAWSPEPSRVRDLGEDLVRGLEQAERTGKSVIVDQDSNDFFFVVHPAGSIDLCCRMRSYEVVREIEP